VVSGLAPAGATARYLAVYGLSWGVATVAAPVLATQVIGSFGPAALWASSSALCLLMACLQPWLLRALRAQRTGSRQSPAGAAGSQPGPDTISAGGHPAKARLLPGAHGITTSASARREQEWHIA